MAKYYEDMNKDEKIDYLEDEIGRLTNKIESLKNQIYERNETIRELKLRLKEN